METLLCELAFKYGTDKCPKLGHSYTPIYYDLLKDKQDTFKKVLEIGIGSKRTMFRVPDYYQVGASLRMWRDFFPNAQIYGIDIDPGTMFEDERITTFLANQKNTTDIIKLLKKIGTDIDLVVDDGSHQEFMQSKTFRLIMPRIKKEAIYVIEDAKRPYEMAKSINKEYDCQVYKFSPKHKQDTLLVIKNK